MDLGELKRRAYAQSKNFSVLNTVVQYGLVAFAVWAAVAGTPASPWFGLVAFIGPIVNFALKDRSRHHYGYGERARRAQLLQDGLGRKPSQAEMLDLADNRALLPAIDPKPLESEFASDLQPGPARLAHITQEAAYYTRSRATFVGRWYFGLMCVGILGTVCALWWFVQDPVTEIAGVKVTGQSWAKAAVTLLVFFVAGSFAEKWRAFESLAKTAGSTFEKCDALHKGQPSELEVLLAIAPYDIALGRAPAIPTSLHWVGRKQLHEDWKAQMKSDKAPAGPS